MHAMVTGSTPIFTEVEGAVINSDVRNEVIAASYFPTAQIIGRTEQVVGESCMGREMVGSTPTTLGDYLSLLALEGGQQQ